MNEILPNVWLGDITDGCSLQEQEGKWLGICVLDTRPDNIPENHIWIPVLTRNEDGGDLYAYIDNLNHIITKIQAGLKNGFKVLVYCGAGLERSPMTIAYFIFKELDVDLESAYTWIKKFRGVFNRAYWIYVGLGTVR